MSVLTVKDLELQVTRWCEDMHKIDNLNKEELKTGPHKNWWNKIMGETLPIRNFDGNYVYHYTKAFLICVARSCAESAWSAEMESKARKALFLPEEFPLDCVYLGPDCDPASATTCGQTIPRRSALEIMWRIQAVDVFRRSYVTKQLRDSIGEESIGPGKDFPKQLEGCTDFCGTVLKETRLNNKDPKLPATNKQICCAALDSAIALSVGYFGALDNWEAWSSFDGAPAMWLQNRAIELALYIDRSPAFKILKKNAPPDKKSRSRSRKGVAPPSTRDTDSVAPSAASGKRKPRSKAKAGPRGRKSDDYAPRGRNLDDSPSQVTTRARKRSRTASPEPSDSAEAESSSPAKAKRKAKAKGRTLKSIDTPSESSYAHFVTNAHNH